MLPPNAAASKFAATYEFGAPDCELKTAELPWNQLVVPAGALLFAICQPVGTRFATVSKFSASVMVVADAVDAVSSAAAATMPANARSPHRARCIVCRIRVSLWARAFVGRQD